MGYFQLNERSLVPLVALCSIAVICACAIGSKLLLDDLDALYVDALDAMVSIRVCNGQN